VEGRAGVEVVAVEEDLVVLGLERQREAFGQCRVLAGIGQEDPHRRPCLPIGRVAAIVRRVRSAVVNTTSGQRLNQVPRTIAPPSGRGDPS